MGSPHRPNDQAPRAEAGHRKESSPAFRGHLALLEENRGETPWCGPATLALATGRSYAEACTLLRSVAPAWYPAEGPIVTAYWRDLTGALDIVGVPHAPVQLPERRQSLIRFARAGLPTGWYLVRITDHFLLLRSHGFGLTTLYDNRHTGVLVSAKTHGARHVTHAARLLDGPLLVA
jgi:hypothetical protein